MAFHLSLICSIVSINSPLAAHDWSLQFDHETFGGPVELNQGPLGLEAKMLIT